jgi:hypothetical protein
VENTLERRKIMASEVKIEIPSSLIEDTIRMEMIRQMPNKEGIMAEVIKKAMQAKKDNYSNSKTIFQETFESKIMSTVNEIIGEWMEVHREEVKDHIVKYLTKGKNEFLNQFAEALMNGVTKYSIGVHIDLNRER